MTKEEFLAYEKLENANRLLKERVAYLESIKTYIDPVKAVTNPTKNIPM